MIESGNNRTRLGICGCVSLLYSIFFLLISEAGVAQVQQYEIKLLWSAKPKTISTINGKSVTQPTFTNAAHTQQYGLLPSFFQMAPVRSTGKVTVQVLNAVYAPAQVDNSSLKYIKTNIQATGQISYYHKKPRLCISVLPFRKNPANGSIEKLESFTLKADITPPPGGEKSLQSYAANSVLSSGTWYKISVSADGIYKVDYNFMKKTLGISNPSAISLNTLGVFGNGGGMVPDVVGIARPDDLTENPTMVVDVNGNGLFDNGDYLLFYGQMPDAWVYDTAQKSFSHQKNLYTQSTYYFLTTDAGTGKRVQTQSTSLTPSQTITVFDDHEYHDNDLVSLLKSGKEWLGEEMTSFSPSQSLSFSFPNIVTSTPVKINSLLGVAVDNSSSTTTISINGQAVLTQTDGGISTSNNEYPYAYNANSASGTYNASSAQLNLTYNFVPQSDPTGSAACYIDWVELIAQRQLTMNGDAMTFRSIASTNSPACNFVLGNAGSSTVVWDVTSLGSIAQMPGTLNGSSLSFTAATSQLQEFIAFNSGAAFGNPGYVNQVSNQNLHAMGQPNLVIVAYDDFLQAADVLAAYHRSYDSLTVQVAPVSEVYNEFGSGKPDISAIRDMMVMLYNRAGSDTALMPRYLLLLGDGSFDPEGRTPGANNFVNVYESYNSYDPLSSYTSDDFFGLLDVGDGGDIGGYQLLDIGVGRLTADNETEAEGIANKIKNYHNLKQGCTTCAMANTNNSWRNVQTFVADYPFEGDVDFEQNTDQLAESTRAQYPVYNYSKIYCDAYKLVPTPAGDRFPDCNTAILNQINSGTLTINWVGHGDEVTWSNGRIFTLSEMEALDNQYLPLFITATCEFGEFDGTTLTGGQILLDNSSGGAIGLISAVRLVFESSNTSIDNAVYGALYARINGVLPTLGQIVAMSKNNPSVIADAVNDRKFTLLGDPALTLDYPKDSIVTDSIDHKSVAVPHDTLKALTRITVSGHLTDNNNNKLTGFSGTVYPEVYDKISQLATLNNNDYGSVMNFVEYTSLLFKGTASVTNGNFSFSFIVPKDINYQYGPGRISYYADNGTNLTAKGYSNAITVGGASDTAHSHTAGPKITIYMDDANFAYGGLTNPNPLLLVNLQDPGGINTTGNGVGHNLTAILDNNYQSPIVLNNYYQSALNDFTQGQVRYPFSNLSAGAHTLMVKAWDIYDNSSEANTEFVVTNSTNLALNHVYNYPNPFTTSTEFMFEDNVPCDALSVNIQIYSVSGRLVKSIEQQVQSTGYRVDGIMWDGLDDFGSRIGKGVYIYKLNVKDQTTGSSAHQFEKLVLLR